MTEVRISDYLHKHLDSSTAAFDAIDHMHSNWNNSKLDFTFLEYTKDTLNLVYPIETYSFLLRSFCQVGVHDFNQMKNFDCLPDSVTYNTLLNGFSCSGNVIKAREILLEMLLVDGSSCSCSPDVVTFTSTISGYCKQCNMQEALLTLILKMVKMKIMQICSLYVFLISS
ncbi:hypothetical protein L2E82_26728 [Cichorium intybus]|uniref:Uncharacterized protein n=1 Tax=Cichorium intybus TaxID=13427 RepID=A0ACB9CRF3_CICIN|nr:hypothetical protein L2E82_26728 [Cichorium intybus]